MNRDLLDEAIDQVATRLTQMEDDPALASRIVAALPERVSWFGWLFHSWVPRLAMIAIIVTAGLLWARRGSSVMPVPAPIATVSLVQPVAAPPPVVAQNPAPGRTKPLERLEPLEPLEPARADHERSLTAVAVLAPLDVESLTSPSVPAGRSIDIAPLAVADLPLSADFSSQRY